MATSLELFELAPDIRALAYTIEDPDLSEADQDKAINELLARREQLTETAEQLALYAQEQARLAEAVKAEADRLAAKAKRASNTAARLKGCILAAMKLADLAKLRGKLISISVANNGGQEPLAIDIDKLPMDFVEYTPAANGTKIREALSKGATIPGVTVLPRGQHLRIS